MKQAVQFRVQGTVQGVGFRPFVYRIARKYELTGWVCNDANGVDIFVQGETANLSAFADTLDSECPPLAQINDVKANPVELDSSIVDFQIRASRYGEKPLVDIARDTTVCPACLTEMNDPDDRRYQHPFINCTDCGPRYTIIQQLPYDRPSTTMSEFKMCDDCRSEYEDPANRRFHAQPVSCLKCGPTLSLELATAIAALKEGKIVAIKGLGGFHLCCRADLEETVQQLRNRKGREDRPFALMARNTEVARTFAEISPSEQELLESIERPIVVLNARPDIGCAESVAPGVSTLGIMLPYTPIHELLFAEGNFDVLVMTSGNLSGEPLCKDNDEAEARLNGVADLFLMHDRDIEVRLDDSIVRVLGDEPVLLRRARGYVPSPLPAPYDVNGIVALGGIMKSTVCVGRQQTAYVSQYLGTLDNTETVDHASFVLNHLTRVLGVDPQHYVMDLHPGGLQKYLISEEQLENVMLVQHHHAHAAACMAENSLEGRALCVVYDGLGMGDDGTIWGGEILLSEYASSQRVGHLELLDLPGGDAATEYPGRIAYTALNGLVDQSELDSLFDWMTERPMLAGLADQPCTSSMGRLFDALSALLGICQHQTYEGQAAIELEAIADGSVTDSYDISLNDLIMPGKLLLKAAFEDLLSGTPKSIIAAKFHQTIATWTAEIVEQSGEEQVCLCGGCFQNALLLSVTLDQLKRRGIVPYVHRRLSPGDESISYGQLITAAARLTKEKEEQRTLCV